MNASNLLSIKLSHQKAMLISAIALMIFWLAKILFVLKYINCGFDITDEAYYHLYMQHPEKMGWIIYVHPLAYLFSFLSGNVVLSRLFKIFSEHLAAILLTISVFRVLIKQCSTNNKKTAFFLLLCFALNGCLLGYTPRSFSYNDAAWFLMVLAVALYLPLILNNTNKTVSYLLLLSLGFITTALFFIKPYCAIFLFMLLSGTWLIYKKKLPILKEILLLLAGSFIGLLCAVLVYGNPSTLLLILQNGKIFTKHFGYSLEYLLKLYCREDWLLYSRALPAIILFYFIYPYIKKGYISPTIIIFLITTTTLIALIFWGYYYKLALPIFIFFVACSVIAYQNHLHQFSIKIVITLLLLLPFCYSIGSNMGISYHLFSSAITLLVSLGLLTILNNNQKQLFLIIIMTISITSIVTYQHYYRNPNQIYYSLNIATVKTKIGKGNLLLPQNQASFYNTLDSLIYSRKYDSNISALPLSISPGITFATGLKPLKYPFLFPTLSQKAIDLNSFLINSLRAEDINPLPIIFLCKPADNITIQQLNNSLFKFEQNYHLLATIPFPFAEYGVHKSVSKDGLLYIYEPNAINTYYLQQ